LGEDEARVVDGHIAGFAGTVGRLSRDQRGWPSNADLMTWRGSLADFGAWTGAADLYVGYDSAAAHVAAAHATPVIEIFAGAPSERFRHRWTPAGTAPVRILPAIGPADLSALLQRLAQLLDRSTPRQAHAQPDD
jgi:ADP-heptose:LPS heptosyltransferase